jgi:surface polysaccharide O-acyltransferase-like enzyme
MASTISAPREHGLDWLRVIAFTILIGYHTGMFFVPWDFHIKNPERSESLTWVMLFFNRWRLPLLFLISGAGVAFALRRRGYAEFAGERLRRLLLPLVFGMLVVVPPQIYFERLDQGIQFASYLDFWKTVFAFQPYPQGNLSWHHLWFVVYILVYSLVCIPVFAALKSRRGQAAVDAFARFCEKPGAIYLIGLPNLAIAAWLGPKWPTTHNLIADWANLTGALLTFLWGFVICGNGRFFDLIVRKRRELLLFALVMTVLFYGYRLTPLRESWTPLQRMSASMLIDSYMGFGWILALLGWSRVKLNRDSPLLRYATEAVYPFYIVHQTITIAIAYYMIPWTAPVAVKFPLLAAGTFLGSWAVFEVVRRNPVTRLLFGMKAKPPAYRAAQLGEFQSVPGTDSRPS